MELEASKSSLIFSVIEEEETPAQASTESMMSYLRGVDHEYNRSGIFIVNGYINALHLFPFLTKTSMNVSA